MYRSGNERSCRPCTAPPATPAPVSPSVPVGPARGLLFAAALLLPATCPAQFLPGSVSTSGVYRVYNSAVGECGGRMSGGPITLDCSVGEPVAGGVATYPDARDRAGFTGQLFDLRSINIYPSPTSVPEDTLFGFNAELNLDDQTILDVDRLEFTWSSVSGPVAADSDGLFTSAAVFEDTPAAIRADYLSLSSQLDFLVANTDPDNYQSYGGDSIDDAWQVNFFGAPPNPDAAASADADGDGDSNFNEWITDFDPTDPASFLQLTVTSVDRTADTIAFSINKVAAGRTYTIRAGTDLDGPFTETVTTLAPGPEETDKAVQATGVGPDRKFYQLEATYSP